MSGGDFVLDQRLAGDAAHVCDWRLSGVHLMNDRRYAWLVLVPRRAGMVEPFDLDATDQAALWRDVMHAGAALKRATGCRKINIAALGNIVAQLHVHVVARNEGDAAWPGPVWGQGQPERYDAAALQRQIERWRGLLHPPTD